MKEIENYTLVYGSKPTIDRFSKIYVQFFLQRKTVNACKKKFKTKDFLSLAKKKEDVIGKDLIKDNEPETLKKFGLELTEGRDRNVLKNMHWGKRKGTAWKVEPCAKFLEEEKISFLNLF